MADLLVYILDRKVASSGTGRMRSNASSAYPRVHATGVHRDRPEHRCRPVGGVRSGEADARPAVLPEGPDFGINDAIDVTTDGSILYDVSGELREYSKDGKVRSIWSCSKHSHSHRNARLLFEHGQLVEADDTVMLSFPYLGTAVRINRKTCPGRQYGNQSGSYAFSPSPWQFEFQHSPSSRRRAP